MLTRALIPQLGLDPDLLAAVRVPLESGAYSDAVLWAFRHLTEALRTASGESGDGQQLVGRVLGGSTPLVRINNFATESETNEQKGVEQIIRGMYQGFRNPRAHDPYTDTEDFCIRILIMVDTLTQILRRNVTTFDVGSFVDRVYDPYFVPSEEYADALVEQVPSTRLLDVFSGTLVRRQESEAKKLAFAFRALYRRLSPEELSGAAAAIGDALRSETDESRIAELFRLLRADMWGMLPTDVRLRMEQIIRDECRKGHFDAYTHATRGALGTWGNTFGRHFSTKAELVEVLRSLLYSSWYTQNYVGTYYLAALPAIVDAPEEVSEIADGMAYALLTNKAIVMRNRFREVCVNYPDRWKEELRRAIQEESTSDPDYASEVLALLV